MEYCKQCGSKTESHSPPFSSGGEDMETGDDYKSYFINVKNHHELIVVYRHKHLRDSIINFLNARFPKGVVDEG